MWEHWLSWSERSVPTSPVTKSTLFLSIWITRKKDGSTGTPFRKDYFTLISDKVEMFFQGKLMRWPTSSKQEDKGQKSSSTKLMPTTVASLTMENLAGSSSMSPLPSPKMKFSNSSPYLMLTKTVLFLNQSLSIWSWPRCPMYRIKVWERKGEKEISKNLWITWNGAQYHPKPS